MPLRGRKRAINIHAVEGSREPILATTPMDHSKGIGHLAAVSSRRELLDQIGVDADGSAERQTFAANLAALLGLRFGGIG